MTTITTKIAKNGSLNVKINGKRARYIDAEDIIDDIFKTNVIITDNTSKAFRISYRDSQSVCFVDNNGNLYKACRFFTEEILRAVATDNMSRFLTATAEQLRDIEEAAIDDYATTAEAFDEAVNAEIEAADNNNNTEEEKTMTANNTKAAKIAAIENAIQAVIAERNEAYAELDAAEDNDEIAQWFIDQLKENLEDLGNQYWELVAELDAAKAEPDDDDDPEPPTNDTPETDASEDDDAPTSEKSAVDKLFDLKEMIKVRTGKGNRQMWFGYGKLISKSEAEEYLRQYGLTIDEYLAALPDYEAACDRRIDEAFAEHDRKLATNNTPETSRYEDAPTAEEQAAHIASQFQKMRQFAYKLISVEYLTNSQVNSILIAIFADNANAEQVKRLVEKFNADNDRYIDACSKTIKNILDDEAKRAELDNKNVFDLLPELDELNDVDEDEPTSAPLTEELRFTPYGNVRQRLFIGDEKIRFFDDEFLDLWNGKYRVGVHQLGITTVHVAVDDEDGESHFEKFDMDELPEEFWSLMTNRGACSIDEPPTIDDDDLKPELIVGTKITARDSVILKVDGKRASRATAEEKIYANGDFTVINEFGKVFDGYVTRDGALRILRPEGNSLRFANVAEMVDHLAFDNIFHDDEPPTIDDGDPEPPTEKPTEDVPDTIAAVAATIQDLNDHAPDGWEVFYNADNKNFTVAFDEKPVANLDSLALLKVLPPDEFFSKFQSSADEQFTADRVDEIAALKEMRQQLAGDTERLKIIDDLINDATRAAILG